jgi:hypothetical protein
MSHECGATTQSGNTCRRKVRGAEGVKCPLHIERTDDEQCSICLNKLEGACKTLPCGHVFHRRCILQWKRTGHHTCPYCREPFDQPAPTYRITVTVENTHTQRTFTHVSNVIPNLIQQMNIITPDALLTDIVLDITDHEALAEVLADLGIDPTLNF